MKVLVTGATGFIGRRLCADLIARGIEVRATFRRAMSLDHHRVDWRPMTDIAMDERAWRPLLTDVDAVVHLAALAHQVGRAGRDRYADFRRTNVDATASLARACTQSRVRRLVFMSSIAAQTDAGLRSDYGRSKIEAERVIETTLSGTAVDWCSLRPPLLYGPANPGNMARLLRLIRTGVPLPLASIRNCRSFMYVDNLTDAIATVIAHPRSIRSSYAVSDGTDLSTPDLIRALGDASGMRVRLIKVPVWALRAIARVGDIAGAVAKRSLPFDSYSVDRLTESLTVDGSSFRETFGWKPPVSMQEGLAVTCRDIAEEAAANR